MGVDKWQLFGRLRRTVKKIRFLINFNINRWKLAAAIGASSSKRRLSFNDRPQGLAAACIDNDTDSNDSGSSRGLQRTMSSPMTPGDDIDKRAETFINNFYRQLRMERQVSLQLRYCRGNSFDQALASPC